MFLQITNTNILFVSSPIKNNYNAVANFQQTNEMFFHTGGKPAPRNEENVMWEMQHEKNAIPKTQYEKKNQTSTL